jgi:hypothetical protein
MTRRGSSEVGERRSRVSFGGTEMPLPEIVVVAGVVVDGVVVDGVVVDGVVVDGVVVAGGRAATWRTRSDKASTRV